MAVTKSNKPEFVGKMSKRKLKQGEAMTPRPDNSDGGEPGDEELPENQYRKLAKQPRVRHLMPIKTRRGVIRRQVVVPDDVSLQESPAIKTESTPAIPIAPLRGGQLLAGRRAAVLQAKTQMGVACRQLLESPQEKYELLQLLLNYMSSEDQLAAATIRKYATLSLLEVFRDLLPAYTLHEHDLSGQQLKKDTLALYRYENALVAAYKRYLVRLESCMRNMSASVNALRNLALLSLRCMCDCLVEFGDFNYGSNVADALVSYLSHANDDARRLVTVAISTLFSRDKRAERSLQLVRRISQHVKSRQYDCRAEIIDLFLTLPIRDVNLDREKESMIKEKKFLTYKEKLKAMSRRERKRSKKLEALEREMTATRAQECVQQKERYHTEIVTIVFSIYFRILKHMPRSKLMSSVLQGLARFAHMINVDFFLDMLESFHSLLTSGVLASNRDALLCVQTVFCVLSGQGTSLTLDPQRFYGHCYRAIDNISPVEPERELLVALNAIDAMLVRRRRKVSTARVMAFAKRLATLSLSWQHPAQLATLALLRSMMMAHPSMSLLVQLDDTEGSTSVYRSDVNDPEYCGAQSSRLFELTVLTRSYHIVVRELAAHLLSGCPSQAGTSLQQEIRDNSLDDWLSKYSVAEVQFVPGVPTPASLQLGRKRRPCVTPEWLTEASRVTSAAETVDFAAALCANSSDHR